MAKYCGAAGAVHEITEQYCGAAGAVHEISAEYAGVGGAVKTIYTAKPKKNYVDVFKDGNFTSVVSAIRGGDADNYGDVNWVGGSLSKGFTQSAIKTWVSWTPGTKEISLMKAYDEDMECTCYGYITICSSSLYKAKEIEVTCSSYSGTLRFITAKTEYENGINKTCDNPEAGVFVYTNPRYGSSGYTYIAIRTTNWADIESIRFVVD